MFLRSENFLKKKEMLYTSPVTIYLPGVKIPFN